MNGSSTPRLPNWARDWIIWARPIVGPWLAWKAMKKVPKPTPRTIARTDHPRLNPIVGPVNPTTRVVRTKLPANQKGPWCQTSPWRSDKGTTSIDLDSMTEAVVFEDSCDDIVVSWVQRLSAQWVFAGFRFDGSMRVVAWSGVEVGASIGEDIAEIGQPLVPALAQFDVGRDGFLRAPVEIGQSDRPSVRIDDHGCRRPMSVPFDTGAIAGGDGHAVHRRLCLDTHDFAGPLPRRPRRPGPVDGSTDQVGSADPGRDDRVLLLGGLLPPRYRVAVDRLRRCTGFGGVGEGVSGAGQFREDDDPGSGVDCPAEPFEALIDVRFDFAESWGELAARDCGHARHSSVSDHTATPIHEH